MIFLIKLFTNPFFIIGLLLVIIIVLLILNLISKRKEIKAKLDISNNLDDEKRLRNYLFKVTHEIKNPIAVCKGYLDMMNLKDEEKSSRYINIIKSEIERTLIILEDTLGYNKIKIEKDIMDITMLLEEVKDSFKDLLKNKDIKLQYRIKSDELLIIGDYNRIKQVIINMIKNSMDAKKDKETLIIKVSLKRAENSVFINISDNGIGMDEEIVSNIGKEFFTTKNNGTGLGVSISKDIISKHDGELIYTSKKNIGTKATIILPINYEY